MILAERAARLAAEAKLAEAANAQPKQSSTEALIAHLKLAIEKLRRTLYGARSERAARLLDQLELELEELEELEAAATEDELAAEKAAGKTQTVRSFERKRPLRQPFPDDIERERVVLPAPTQCPCCGSARLSKLGERVTSTLEAIPRRFK
ncbi:zinc-finger binding domain of transposase IS66 [Bradyrhizobium sp. Ghvi]|nr:zinc-finger binding domain of transposase IS66 [Bradyrhizobium sp. Ghvi]